LLAAILWLGAALRVYQLNQDSLWLDEVGQAIVAQQPIVGILKGVQLHHGAAPLDYLITGLIIRITRAEWALRLPSVLWGTLSVYWLYRLGRRLQNPTVGLTTALLLAINPLHLRYSQEVRFYALFVCLTLISTEALWDAWQRPGLRAWALYAGIITLMLYSHYYGGLVLGFHALWVFAAHIQSSHLADRRLPKSSHLTGFVLSAGAALLAFSLWLWFAVFQERGAAVFAPPTFDRSLFKTVLLAFGGRSLSTWELWAVLAGIGLLAGFRRDLKNWLMVAAWVILPLPLVVLIDQRVNYFFDVRQVLFVLPLYLLLVATGAAIWAQAVRGLAHRWSMGKSQLVEKVAMGAITLVLVLTALPQVDRYYRERRDDWRSVGQMLEYNLKPQDMVVLFNVVPYVGYYSRRAVQQVWPARSLADVQQAYAAGQPLWVLLTPYLEQIPEAKEIRDWIDRQPSLNFDFGLAMHLHYLHAGKTQSDLLQATKQFHLPDRPELWAAFGKALSTIEAKADAQRAFECAAKLVTDSHQEASYLFDAANMAYLQGKHSEALVLYDRVLALEPDHSDAHTHLRQARS